jgi:hypothetical protein
MLTVSKKLGAQLIGVAPFWSIKPGMLGMPRFPENSIAALPRLLF